MENKDIKEIVNKIHDLSLSLKYFLGDDWYAYVDPFFQILINSNFEEWDKIDFVDKIEEKEGDYYRED